MSVLDVIASRVHGLVKARDVRIVYSEGRLYIAKSPEDIQVFTTDEPQRRSGAYSVTVGDARISWQLPTCGSCKRRVLASPVGQMSVQDLIEAGESISA